MTAGIYEIVNSANGKRYIGSTVNLRLRRNHHYKQLRAGQHHSVHLQRAWDKYGAEAFSFLPLLICEPKNLILYEQRAMDAFCPEYNIAQVAGSRLGVICKPETRAKIAMAHRGRTRGPQTAEHRENSAASHRGLKRDRDARYNISRALRSSNRIISYVGNSYPMAEWARIRGIKITTLCYRLRHGWSVEEALMQPTRNYNKPPRELRG